jgi:hypothetical protein
MYSIKKDYLKSLDDLIFDIEKLLKEKISPSSSNGFFLDYSLSEKCPFSFRSSLLDIFSSFASIGNNSCIFAGLSLDSASSAYYLDFKDRSYTFDILFDDNKDQDKIPCFLRLKISPENIGVRSGLNSYSYIFNDNCPMNIMHRFTRKSYVHELLYQAFSLDPNINVLSSRSKVLSQGTTIIPRKFSSSLIKNPSYLPSPGYDYRDEIIPAFNITSVMDKLSSCIQKEISCFSIPETFEEQGGLDLYKF